MNFKLNVNGKKHRVNVDPEKPLLWVLREELGLTGTKFGCGTGICGSCAVLIDGELRKSCRVEIAVVGSKAITTIEGLHDEIGKTVKEAWLADEVSQCGYCQPGQIITATHLLSNNRNPSDDDIDQAMTGLCRCGAYQRIRTGIKTAAKSLREE